MLDYFFLNLQKNFLAFIKYFSQNSQSYSLPRQLHFNTESSFSFFIAFHLSHNILYAKKISCFQFFSQRERDKVCLYQKKLFLI